MSPRILADENMPGLERFARHGELQRMPGRRISRADLMAADAVLVRSVTRLDAELLTGTPVRFAGSATIGTDHVDRGWLAEQGIVFAHAPGCNAVAVAEYDLQAVLDWLVECGRRPADTTVAVIGCGHVGTRAAELFRAAGLAVRVCDPPRQRRGERLPGTPVALDTALEADVVTLHVPLTRDGEDATFHMLNEQWLGHLGPEQLLINTSRGAVVDNAALARCLSAGGPEVVLDVWEGEPRIDPALFRLCRQGTPHVAGYSREGKERGTARVYQAFCEWLGEPVEPEPVDPPPGIFPEPVGDAGDMLGLLRSRYDLRRDHAALKGALDGPDPGAAFDELRRNYPLRHECAGLRVCAAVAPAWGPVLQALGVRQPC